MTSGKILELLTMGLGGVGGFYAGGKLAKHVINKSNPGEEIYPEVTDRFVEKHPRLKKFVENKLEKDAAGNIAEQVKKAPTSLKTLAAMAGIGFGAGLPAGAFYNWKMHNKQLQEKRDMSGLEHAHAITDLTTDIAMNALDRLKEKRQIE